MTCVGGRLCLEDNGETPDTQDALFEYPGFSVLWSHREITDGTVDREGMELLLQQEVADGTVAVAPPYEQLVDVAVAAEAARALGPDAN